VKDETMIKMSRLGVGAFLAALYAITGANGVITLLAAFLLSVPIDQFITRRRED